MSEDCNQWRSTSVVNWTSKGNFPVNDVEKDIEKQDDGIHDDKLYCRSSNEK